MTTSPDSAVYRWVTVSTRTTHAYLVRADAGATDEEIYDSFLSDVPSTNEAALVDEDGFEVEIDGRHPSAAEISEHRTMIFDLGDVRENPENPEDPE
jgi:hypothetical protein